MVWAARLDPGVARASCARQRAAVQPLFSASPPITSTFRIDEIVQVVLLSSRTNAILGD